MAPENVTSDWLTATPSDPHHRLPSNPQRVVLWVTGQTVRRGYRVGVLDKPCIVRPAQFEYLLELVAAAFLAPDTPQLYIWDTVCTEGDTDRTRHVVQRLRDDLGERSLVDNNNQGGYSLAICPSQIALSDTLWRLPHQLIAKSVLCKLRSAQTFFIDSHTSVCQEERSAQRCHALVIDRTTSPV